MIRVQRWLQLSIIERLSRKKDYEGLLRALEHQDESVSQAAAQALIRAGTEAVPSLAGLLKGKDLHLRRIGVDLLGRIGDEACVPPLTELLAEDEIQESHQAAIVILGQIGSPKAIKPLIELLVRIVNQTIWESAKPLYDPSRIVPAVRALVEIKSSLLKIGETSIPMLIETLDHPNPLVRRHIARTLALFGKAGVQRLVEMLNNPQSHKRRLAAEGLDHIFWEPLQRQEQYAYWIARQDWESLIKVGSPAISSLLPFLQDADDTVCRAVAQTLQKIGWLPMKNAWGARYWVQLHQWEHVISVGEAAVPVLVEFIERRFRAGVSVKDRQQEINRASAALVRIGPAAIRASAAAMQSDLAQMQRAMAEVLWQIGGGSIPALLGLIDHPNEQVREQAVWALGKLGVQNRDQAQHVLSGLNQALNDRADNVSRMAASSIGEIGARYPELVVSSVPVLIAMLKDNVETVGQQAAISLGMIRDNRAVLPLIETLFGHNVSLRALSAAALGNIGDQRAVEPLIRALEQPVYGIQAAAASALGLLGDQRAVEPLIASLKSKEAEVRRQAAASLGKLGDQRAVDGLLSLLYDANLSVKLAAIKSLGKLGSPSALPRLVGMLKSPQSGIQDAAAEAIMNIGGEPAAERLMYFLIEYSAGLVWDPFSANYNPETVEIGKRTVEKVKTILLAIGEKSLRPVINSLAYSNPQVRQVSREILGKIGKPAELELMRALIHSDRFMRMAAAEELEKMGWKPKKDAIGAAYWFARQEWENGVKNGSAAVDPLIALFRDSDEAIQRKAVECLDRIGWQPSQDAVGADYWIIKRNWQECAGIGEAAVPSLVAFFADMVRLTAKEPHHPDYRANRDGAASALVSIGEAAIEPLLSVLKENPETAGEPVIEIFSQIGKPASAPLLSALKSHQLSIRRLAARALKKMALEETVEPLIMALDDPDDEVCREAVIALGNIGRREAVEPLVLRLSDLKEDIRREAAIALGKIGDYRAQVPLIKALQDISEEVRIAAANALAKVGNDQAVPPLINALRREGEGVQKAAAEALLAIGGSLVIEMLIDLLTGITDSTNWNPDSQTYDLKATLTAGYIQIKTKWVLAELAPDSIEPLIAALKGRSDQVRFHLHQALGMIGEPAVAALLRRLEDADLEWRKLAADALDAIHWKPGSDRYAAAYWAVRRDWKKCAEIGEAAVPVLIQYLTQYDAWERMAVAEALRKIGWQPGSDADGAVFWIARQEWRKLADLRQVAVIPLINALNDYTRQVEIGTIDREEGMGVIGMIRQTLIQIGKPAVAPLVEDFRKCSPETRPHISAILVGIGEEVVDSLSEIVAKENAVLRAEAVAIAGSVHSEKAIPLLQRALQDPAFIVREKAVEGLEKTGKTLRESKLRVELIEKLVASLKDPHSRVRDAAQHALKSLDWQGK